jgi:threonine synthase
MQWQQDLAGAEGLYIEPASAGTLAAVAQLKGSGHIKATDTVVTLLTASGLKDPDATASVQGQLVTVSGNIESAYLQLKALKLKS